MSRIPDTAAQRSQPGKRSPPPAERRSLLKFGKPVGLAIKELITIVTPRTFARWASGEKSDSQKAEKKPGQPRTAESIRDLIVRIAKETGFGHPNAL